MFSERRVDNVALAAADCTALDVLRAVRALVTRSGGGCLICPLCLHLRLVLIVFFLLVEGYGFGGGCLICPLCRLLPSR